MNIRKFRGPQEFLPNIYNPISFRKKFFQRTILFFLTFFAIIAIYCLKFHQTPNQNSTSEQLKWHQIPGKRILISPFAYEDVLAPIPRIIKLLALKHKNESIKYFCYIHTNDFRFPIYLGAGKEEFMNNTVGHFYDVCYIFCSLPISLKNFSNFLGISVSEIPKNQSTAYVGPMMAKISSLSKRLVRNLTVCVSPLANYDFWPQMQLFLLYYASQKVDKILLYKIDWSVKVEAVLQNFAEKHSKMKVEIVRWPKQFPKLRLDENRVEDPNNDIYYRGKILAINDCTLRELHRSRYVASIDVDELL